MSAKKFYLKLFLFVPHKPTSSLLTQQEGKRMLGRLVRQVVNLCWFGQHTHFA